MQESKSIEKLEIFRMKGEPVKNGFNCFVNSFPNLKELVVLDIPEFQFQSHKSLESVKFEVKKFAPEGF